MNCYQHEKEEKDLVDLTAKPYHLSEEDCNWVQRTIADMSDEEKVGNCFFSLPSHRMRHI